MRRATTVTLAAVAFAATAAVPFAGVAAAQEVPATVDCATLGVLADPTCLVVDAVRAPVEEATAEVLGDTAASPDGGSPAAPPASGSTAQATSSGSPTAAGVGALPTASDGAALPRGASSPAVPDVPMGATLELGPLALPQLGLGGTPAVTASELAASDTVADDVVLPAARAAAELPDRSRATAVAMAAGLLLLAAGLLVDQLRKARLPLGL